MNKIVTIGEQIWMCTNLDVCNFRNGDPIFEAKSAEEFVEAEKKEMPAWLYYNCNPENNKNYGKLYNCFSVNDIRGIAPEGWHIPSPSEYDDLINYFGREEVAGKKLRGLGKWLYRCCSCKSFNER